MTNLSSLKNTHRPTKNVQRIGRGPGSGRGKTSGRGNKGDGSRSGYQRRFGHEGGQKPLYKKLPTRGFSNLRFARRYHAISLSVIERLYRDGEVVSIETLADKGIALDRKCAGLKILSNGDLTKKVSIEAAAYSAGALEKLQNQKIVHTVVS